MKKFLLLGTAFLTMFLTTGCVKYSYDITIDKKGNVDILETEAINVSMLESFGFDNKSITENYDSKKAELEKEGYEVSSYRDSDYRGITRKKHFDSNNIYIDSLPKGFKVNAKAPVEKSSFYGIKDVYKINWTYSFKDASAEMSDGENYQYEDEAEEPISTTKEVDKDGYIVETSKYASGAVVTQRYKQDEYNEVQNALKDENSQISKMLPKAELVIRIPYPAVKNSADAIPSPTEYHWNLLKANEAKDVSIILEYEHYNIGAIIGYLALLLSVVGFIMLNKILKRDDVTY